MNATTICRVDVPLLSGAALRELPYGACYAYSPAGGGGPCERSRLMRSLLKAGDLRFMRRYAERVRLEVDAPTVLTGFFSAADWLVPVPGSMPWRRGSGWVAAQLAQGLIAGGLGRQLLPVLHRISPVRKSATSAPHRRPSVFEHYASFAVQPADRAIESIVLIDDVITKGRTLLAAAARLHEAFPETRIRAFALVRTMGFSGTLDRLVEPYVGSIRWQAGDAYRDVCGGR